MNKLYTIKLDNGAKYQTIAQDNMNLKINDWCVIRKDYYLDYGMVIQINNNPSAGIDKKSLPRIQRKATVHDKSKAHENEIRAKSSLRKATALVRDSKLKMNLLNSHYSFDGKLITFQFTANGRIDFRGLVKELAKAFSTRIELRQIGVRDETAIHGGIGICGRELCCCSFLDDFSSINVRMAKEQDLSLTPSSISGACGRLKCCLKFEHAGYRQLEKTMPRLGDICKCKSGKGRVCERNLLTQEVTIQLEGGVPPVTCKSAEINVIKSEQRKVKRKNAYAELDENDAQLKKLED
ncbi:MAG: stage 0 sporulation protein [Victivallaceae bacterium]|nr:stage 0 sporulation protein [Victivallaceae bacterium]